MLYPFILLLSLYKLCYALCIYLYDFGPGLVRGTEEKGVGKAVKYSCLITRAKNITTPETQAEGAIVGMGTQGFVCYNGKFNTSIVKASQSNWPLAKGIPDALGKGI